MNRILSALAGLILLGSPALAQEDLGKRPFKEMDATAFCNYQKWHPNNYMLDNNWQILCALRTPRTMTGFDSLGIAWNESQIRLLQVGGLLAREGKLWKTQIPIFDQAQTRAIRQETRAFADGLIRRIEPSCRAFVAELAAQGHEANAYSLLFSYVLDGRKVWEKFPDKAALGHHATWDGLYWVMYEPRPGMKCGTNSYGYLSYTWADPMGCWPDANLFAALGKRIDLTALLPACKECVLEVQDSGLLILRIDNGNGRFSHELTASEMNRLTLVLSDTGTTAEQKRSQVAAIVGGIALSGQIARNYEQGMEQHNGLGENLQMK